MRFLRSLALLSVLSLASCGPTLVRAGDGWHQKGVAYTVTATPEGRLMPPGWALSSVHASGEGFRKVSMDDMRDLEAKRTEDDGVLVMASEDLDQDAIGKKLEVIAERWLQRVVVAPKGDREESLYDALLRPLKTTTQVRVGLTFGEGETLHGRTPNVARREAFTVPGGEGFELDASLVPEGATTPDTRLYLAVLRGARNRPDRALFIAYTNSPSMFEAGAADAAALARRVRY